MSKQVVEIKFIVEGKTTMEFYQDIYGALFPLYAVELVDNPDGRENILILTPKPYVDHSAR